MNTIVLLTDQSQWQPAAVAKALAAVYGTPVQDHVARAKRCWGWLEEGDAARAEAIAAALRQAGKEARCVAPEQIASIAEPRPLLRMPYTTGGLKADEGDVSW